LSRDFGCNMYGPPIEFGPSSRALLDSWKQGRLAVNQ
jgi:hypothetical protein